MQVLMSFLYLALTTSLAAPLQSTTLSNLVTTNYQYPLEIGQHPQNLQFAAYQDPYSPYLIYNIVPADLSTSPASILANGNPSIPQFPNYNYYYGPPVYDYRFPLSPIYPVLPSYPALFPQPTIPPTSSVPPSDDDGIEKLDSKVDPQKGVTKPAVTIDDDSVTIEAI